MELHIGIGRYYEDKIEWDNSSTNEITGIKLNKNTPCATQFKHNKFGKYVPVCCSFKPKQDEKVWKELNWESKTTGDKIRTVIAHNDNKVKDEIIDILNKRKDIDIVATASTPEATYSEIIETKPEMVFIKYDFGTEMNGLDVVKKSKEALSQNIPVFNIIASDITQEQYIEMKKIAGDKINTVIKEQTESRYMEIIEDYKDYLNNNVEI